MATRPPLPPFTRETAILKVRLAEDGWNSRDPEKVAQAYLEYLYTETGQEIAVKNYYRPRNPEVLKKHADLFYSGKHKKYYCLTCKNIFM